METNLPFDCIAARQTNYVLVPILDLPSFSSWSIFVKFMGLDLLVVLSQPTSIYVMHIIDHSHLMNHVNLLC